MNEETPATYAIDEILRRGWYEPMRALADAAHAACEDAGRFGSVPDRLMLLSQRCVVARVGSEDRIVERFVFFSFAPPGGNWSHALHAARAVVAQLPIDRVLVVTMRGEPDARSVCLAIEARDGETLHLRAPVVPRQGRPPLVGELAATRHAWAEEMRLLTPSAAAPALALVAPPARGSRRASPDRRQPRLRLLPGGRK